ncbi:MAG: serine hydrolase [Pleurocapsa sp.]
MSRKVKSSPSIQQKKTPRSNNKRSTATAKARNRSKSKTVPFPKKKTSKNSKNFPLNIIQKAVNSTTAKPNIRKSSKAKNHRKSPSASLLSVVYLTAIAIGISTILGTMMAIATSFESNLAEETTPSNQEQVQTTNSAQKLEKLFPIASLGKEIPDLKAKLASLAAKYPQIEPEIFIIDLDTKGYVNIEASSPISAASTIKIPVLVAFFQDVDAGKINLEEKLVMTEDLVAGGSGHMQYEKPGSKFTALETATKMMTISDNTATNMLIHRMGGQEKLNRRFIDWGLTATRIRNPLPDLSGTNTTSPEDLGNLLAQINEGELISLRSRDRMLYIMRNIVRNTLLPEGLESDALIAHKTGDIKSVLGDAGIIDMPSGKRYIASVLVKRPDNSPEAKEFIQKMSQVTYQYFQWQQPRSLTSDGN